MAKDRNDNMTPETYRQNIRDKLSAMTPEERREKAIGDWQRLVSKFDRALKRPKGVDPVDTARVRIAPPNYNYLQEVAMSTFAGHNILKMTPRQLEESKILYDPISETLKDINGNQASTIGKESKNRNNVQIFVMAKDGSLYIATHKGQLIKNMPNITHGSFLDDIPVEAAGIIGIVNGKINEVTDQSGHYATDELDMYRFIIKCNNLMPNVFTKDAKINLYGDGGYPKTFKVNDFIKYMENSYGDRNLLHEKLRKQRIEKGRKYAQKLYNSASMLINVTNSNDRAEILDTIGNLPNDKEEKLSKLVNQPLSQVTIFFKDQNHNKYKELISYTPESLLEDAISMNNIKAMKVLLNAGIGKKLKEFHPLHKSISKNNNPEMTKIILDDKNIRQILKLEVSDKKYFINSLELLVKNGSVDLIKDVLKYPEGQELLHKKNPKGLTPIQIAQQKGDTELLKLFEDKVKEQREKSERERIEKAIKEQRQKAEEEQREKSDRERIEKATKERNEAEKMIIAQQTIIQNASTSFMDMLMTEIDRNNTKVEQMNPETIDWLYDETFKKGVFKNHNLPPITPSMIDKVNQLLLKTIDEVGIVDLTYSQEESKEHHDIILPQWHKSIIESDQIDPVIKAYVIAANPEVKKQLDIPKTATIEEIYNNLTKSEFSQDTNLPSKIKDAFNKNAKSSSTNIRSRSKSPIKNNKTVTHK